MKSDCHEATKRPVAIDLFCGAGGMSLGFEQAGIEVIAAVDVDPINIAIHHRNFPNCISICADIKSMSAKEILSLLPEDRQEIDVVFGGPPCQGFSTGGKHLDDDPRNVLIHEFIRLVGELRPSYFVIENVAGLLSPKFSQLLEQMRLDARELGYDVIEPIQTLDAQHYGVPQRRRRVFILGYTSGRVPPSYPAPLPPSLPCPTIWDAISDLAKIDNEPELVHDGEYVGALGDPSCYAKILRGELVDPADLSIPRPERRVTKLSGCLFTKHSPETRARFASTTAGSREPISRFLRLSKENVAPTIRAGTGPANGSFTAPRPIHPESPRCITVREAARLHSFPDWFEFHKTNWHGFRQVGNAVPPLLAKQVAGSVLKAFSSDPKRDRRIKKEEEDGYRPN